ncbi:hypothetical protein PYW07_007597 [Mythimna separata]|uniref:RAP domain-containing protein n=1 Tax=Mythimna separata TaxID=271217 RepID=A0AAD8DU20_MYTSE|nr:hypothetical protein PYW07_007597 [Mythimna separata]
MSLFLKSAWRSVVKGRQLKPLSKSLLDKSFRAITTQPSRPPSDALMTVIKAAPTAAEVLSAVDSHMAKMDHTHMLQALCCLFELQKSGQSGTDPAILLSSPTFETLCQKFKRHARALDVNQALEATKILSFLKVPTDSTVVQTMLQLLRCYINMMNVRQIMFLDFLLSKFDHKNHLVDALKLALPLAFQIRLPLELDSKDMPLLKDMLAYSCLHNLPDRYIDDIVTGLLLHDQVIDAQIAKSIILSLCQVNCTEEIFPTRVQLLHICYDILTQKVEHLSYEEVVLLATKIKSRLVEKHPEYYHEQLMDAVANSVVTRAVGFDKALMVARVLSRIAHTHFGLVGYLCETAADNPKTLSSCRPTTLFSFINCLSNNNYTPDSALWTSIKRQITENPILLDDNHSLPWTKICLEMASLGLYDDKLLKKVFSKESLNREFNQLDYLQLLTLYEAVKAFHNQDYKLPEDLLDKAKSVYPVHRKTDLLEEHLSAGLGGAGYVVKNVVLPNGIISDCLVCLKNGYPVKFEISTGDLRVPVEFLNIPSGSVLLCVLTFLPGCFSMNSNRLRGTFRLVLDILEEHGYAAVAVNANEWLSAPAHERTPYLLRELEYKCGEIGMKLSAS